MVVFLFFTFYKESPECFTREKLGHLCSSEDFVLHKFIRLLKLSSSTFQCFIENENQKDHSTQKLNFSVSSWLVQESFNIICANTNILVDEICVETIMHSPPERRKVAHGIADLLLHVVTTPQSSVTLLRALGGASQALDKFGAGLFLEVLGDSMQHWARVVLTLMKSTSLSVRSIAVDLIVSLL